MSFDLLSEKKRLPAECIIKLNDSEIADLYPVIEEVQVTCMRSNPTEATLVFEARRFEDGLWTVQDDKRFKPWVKVKIEAAFGGKPEEVMRGFIREVRAEYPAEKGSVKVTISCQDHSLLLDRQHKNRCWGIDSPTNDEAITKKILKEYKKYNIEPLATLGKGQQVQALNQNSTDYKFIEARRQANGYELYFYKGKMYFGPMRLTTKPQPNIMVYAGESTNCISINIQDNGHMPDQVAFEIAPKTGSTPQPKVVKPKLKVLGKEPADSSHAKLENFEWRPQRHGISDDAQMLAFAQQLADEQSMKIVADGELDGSLYGHVLRVGELVGVDGLGERYSGTYYVDYATHRFDTSGYRVSFRLLRNAYGDNLTAQNHPLAGVI
jgi:hypothetical protein